MITQIYFFGTDAILLKEGGRENERRPQRLCVEKVQQVEVTPIYMKPRAFKREESSLFNSTCDFFFFFVFQFLFWWNMKYWPQQWSIENVCSIFITVFMNFIKTLNSISNHCLIKSIFFVLPYLVKQASHYIYLHKHYNFCINKEGMYLFEFIKSNTTIQEALVL